MRLLSFFILSILFAMNQNVMASINISLGQAKKLNQEALELIGKGEFHQAEIKLFQSQNIISETRGEQSYEKAKLDNDLGILYSMWKKPAEGERYFLQAFESMQSIEGMQSKHALMVLENLSDLYTRNRHYEKSKLYLNQLSNLYVEKYGSTSKELAKVLHKLARLEEEKGDYHNAKEFYQRELNIRMQHNSLDEQEYIMGIKDKIMTINGHISNNQS